MSLPPQAMRCRPSRFCERPWPSRRQGSRLDIGERRLPGSISARACRHRSDSRTPNRFCSRLSRILMAAWATGQSTSTRPCGSSPCSTRASAGREQRRELTGRHLQHLGDHVGLLGVPAGGGGVARAVVRIDRVAGAVLDLQVQVRRRGSAGAADHAEELATLYGFTDAFQRHRKPFHV